ncbi:hypothetical protein LV564_04125 [Komagataeibacter nataicola]|uniref:hypothetical protein n=1 Tax=Komagataeibacter nataicola TaxID=265960 RepID=UPI0023DD2C53|nr:hypothetical protein [Komagataeibacter nataicola]WEQ56294.1 hypothetical protein LV564_04125 [Komagataeibacter nataicola]
MDKIGMGHAAILPHSGRDVHSPDATAKQRRWCVTKTIMGLRQSVTQCLLRRSYIMKTRLVDSLPCIENVNSIMNAMEQGSAHDKLAYIARNCSPYTSLAFCTLLFPTIIVVDGCFLLEFYYTESNFLDACKNYNNDKRKIEENMNNTFLYEVFECLVEKVSDMVFEEIGKIVRLSWDMVLKQTFPEREFAVKYFHDEQDYGPVVTFCQK